MDPATYNAHASTLYHNQNQFPSSSPIQTVATAPDDSSIDPNLLDCIFQFTIKLIKGLFFGGLTVMAGGFAYLAGSTTSLLFAVGNPSCMLTASVTLICAAAAFTCAKIAKRHLLSLADG